MREEESYDYSPEELARSRRRWLAKKKRAEFRQSLRTMSNNLKARPKHKPFRARLHVTPYQDHTRDGLRWRVGAEPETAAEMELTGPHYGDGSVELANYSIKDSAIRVAVVFQHMWWSTDPGADVPSSLYIHGVDGQIQEERTWPRKSDPPETPGVLQ